MHNFGRKIKNSYFVMHGQFTKEEFQWPIRSINFITIQKINKTLKYFHISDK